MFFSPHTVYILHLQLFSRVLCAINFESWLAGSRLSYCNNKGYRFFGLQCTLFWLRWVWLSFLHCQVSSESLCRRYILLLCRNVICRRRYPRPLQQDDAAVLYAASLQLHLLSSAALSSCALSETSTTKVCRWHLLAYAEDLCVKILKKLRNRNKI